MSSARLLAACSVTVIDAAAGVGVRAADGSVYTWGRGDSGQLGVGLSWRSLRAEACSVLGTAHSNKVRLAVPSATRHGNGVMWRVRVNRWSSPSRL